MKHILAAALSFAAVLAAADPGDAVFSAIQTNGIAVLREALKADPSLANATNGNGLRPLHFAARLNQRQASEALLDAGADPNGVTASSVATPLHFAANADAVDVVRLLLAHGAASDARAVNGRTPLHFAAQRGNDASVNALLKGGADPNAADPQGQTPLHLAAQAGNATTIRVLLAGGADPERADSSGAVPADLAAKDDAIRAFRAVPGASHAATPAPAPTPSPAPLPFAAPAATPVVIVEPSPAPAAPSTPVVIVEPSPAPAAPSAPVVIVEPSPAPVALDPLAPNAPAVDPASLDATLAAAYPDLFGPGANTAALSPEPPSDSSTASEAAAAFRDESIPPADRYQRFRSHPGTRPQPDGSFYNGPTSKGRYEGWGVLLASNGRERYEGWFHRGEKHGHGTYFYANGDTLECEFRDDAPDGAGTFTYANGDSMTGVWRAGTLRDGFGTVPSESGARFHAVWQKGKLVSSTPLE
jgi:hypothetical protein